MAIARQAMVAHCTRLAMFAPCIRSAMVAQCARLAMVAPCPRQAMVAPCPRQVMVAQCSVSLSGRLPTESWHYKAWSCRPAVGTTAALGMVAFPETVAQCAANAAIGPETAQAGRSHQPLCLRSPSS